MDGMMWAVVFGLGLGGWMWWQARVVVPAQRAADELVRRRELARRAGLVGTLRFIGMREGFTVEHWPEADLSGADKVVVTLGRRVSVFWIGDQVGGELVQTVIDEYCRDWRTRELSEAEVRRHGGWWPDYQALAGRHMAH